MDEEIERLLISVRADTAIFQRDVRAMQAELDGPFAAGAAKAGHVLESVLTRALRTGKFGFEDLKRTALSAMADIASAAIRTGLGSLQSMIPSGGIASILTGLIGAPGRAIGGPVSAGRPYMVGERGPELFVPAASGRIETMQPGGAREIRLSITVNAPSGAEPKALQASSRQVARAVKRALMQMED